MILDVLTEYLLRSDLLNLVLNRYVRGKVETYLEPQLGYANRNKFLFFDTPLKPIPNLTNKVVEAKIEQHDAIRAGSHLDFRIKMPDGTIQDFVVTKRIEFPKETGKVLNIVRSPHHSEKYFYTDKAEFQKGQFGYGKMRTVWRGKLDIHHSNKNKMEFSINEGDFKGRYCIRRSNNSDSWFLLRMRQKDPRLSYTERMEYRNTDRARTDAYNQENYIAERKYDGAHYYFVPGEKENLLISRRLDVDNNPIDRAANIPQLKYLKLPNKYWGKRLHVEIINKSENPNLTAGLLNSNPDNSRETQAKNNDCLRAVLFDLQDEDKGYLERKKDMALIARNSPRIDLRESGCIKHRFYTARLFEPRIIAVAEDNRMTGEKPIDYANRLKSEGAEGVVLKNTNGLYYKDPFIKDKKVDTVDLRVVGFQEGTGKYQNNLGALICEDPKTGVTTKVGTGFSDQERSFIWNNQSQINGKLIEVEANRLIHTGSYHGPRFSRFHTEQ